MLKNTLGLLLVSIGLILFSNNQALGASYQSLPYFGARPLSMGGAFVGVADDIHSCYWNPAGMGNIENGEITVMRTMNNRQAHLSEEGIAGGTKLANGGGIGVAYFHNKAYTLETEKTTGRNYCFDIEWLVLSMGGYGQGVFENTAFGVNIRWAHFSLLTGTLTGAYPKQGGLKYEEKGYKASCVDYDFGILHHFNKYFSVGILIQSFQESKIDFGKDAPIGLYQYYLRINPGISLRPDDKTIFAIDLYNIKWGDIYDKKMKVFYGGQSSVRIGFERWCTPNIAIRAGLFGNRFHTAGLGIKGELKRLFPKVKYELDYALLEGGYSGTHFLSSKMRF